MVSVRLARPNYTLLMISIRHFDLLASLQQRARPVSVPPPLSTRPSRPPSQYCTMRHLNYAKSLNRHREAAGGEPRNSVCNSHTSPARLRLVDHSGSELCRVDRVLYGVHIVGLLLVRTGMTLTSSAATLTARNSILSGVIENNANFCTNSRTNRVDSLDLCLLSFRFLSQCSLRPRFVRVSVTKTCIYVI
eukprot:COSAG02_NODE_663_length_18741_cov_9.083682_5_plen_191_part_00